MKPGSIEIVKLKINDNTKKRKVFQLSTNVFSHFQGNILNVFLLIRKADPQDGSYPLDGSDPLDRSYPLDIIYWI